MNIPMGPELFSAVWAGLRIFSTASPLDIVRTIRRTVLLLLAGGHKLASAASACFGVFLSLRVLPLVLLPAFLTAVWTFSPSLPRGFIFFPTVSAIQNSLLSGIKKDTVSDV